MAAPKKSSTKARPKSAKKASKRDKPARGKKASLPTPSTAKTRPDRRAAQRAKKSMEAPARRTTTTMGAAHRKKTRVAASRPARVPPLRRPLTATPVPNRPRGKHVREDRQTPLTNRAPVEVVPEIAGFRPSRILTTRPRPVIRQIDPTGGDKTAPRTLHPWEIDVDDLAELMAARAAEEKAAEEMHARFVSTPESAQARIEEVKATGWTSDPRPSTGLSDARVRLVHENCKFIDGKAVRDVSLSVHPASGRATILIEGGPRLRTASFRMREDEDLPTQVQKLLDDPARFARAEHTSGQELLSRLEELDRGAVGDLRKLAADDVDSDAMMERLRAYVAGFAAVHAAFGLPATVEAVWDRFGGRRGSVLEHLALADDTRRQVADAFDGALDSL